MSAHRPAAGGPLPTRFFVLLGLGVVAGCAGYAALVLQTTTGVGAVALRGTYPYDWPARAYTAAGYLGLRRGLALLAAGALLLGTWLAARPRGRRELAALAGELAGAGRGLGRGWRALQPAQRRLALGGLLLLTLLRGYFSLVAQPYDDATSYELFVREPLLTVSAVYGLPNNHVLSNTLAWLFYQVYPGFWWTMRLPVLLTSTLATVFWFLALLRRSSFGVALGAVGWFGLLNVSLYYAATGRGYWLLAGLGGLGFFALLELAAPRPARARAAWVALVGSGILGLYTVPTHALFLVSAYAWLGGRAARPWDGRRLRQLGALGGLTLLGAALLYAPLLLLSGPALLLHNPYVRALPAAEFGQEVLALLRVPHHVAQLPLVLAILGGAWYLRRRTPAPPAPGWPLLAVSTWFFLLPYALVVLLRQAPPERTLLYKSQYLLIVAGLLAEWALARARPAPARRAVRWGLLGGTLLFAAAQCWRVRRLEAIWQHSWGWQLGAPAVDWLATQPRGPVLAPWTFHCLLLRFYAHTAHRGRPWRIDREPRPGVRYRYFVQPAGRATLAGPPAYQNELLVISSTSFFVGPN